MSVDPYVAPELHQVQQDKLHHLSRSLTELLPAKTEPTTEGPRKTASTRRAAIDPLTGNPVTAPITKADFQDVARALMATGVLVRALLIETRLQNPRLPLTLDLSGFTQTPVSADFVVRFLVDGKHVTASRLVLQNNSGASIYYDVDAPAGLYGLQVAAGNGQSIKIQADTLHLFTTAATPINSQTAAGIVLRAYGIPELTQQRGQRG